MYTSSNNTIKCLLCPKACALKEEEIGNCNARQRQGQDIILLTENKPCSLCIDPMEKKPLYHFYPSEQILSLGMAGCNLHCLNCQNASISQVNAQKVPFTLLTPDNLVDVLKKYQLKHLAYTYTEPLVHYEYVYKCAQKVHEYGGTNSLVTAGYINSKPLKKLINYIDAVNLDIKFMENELYKQNCDVTLKTILQTAEILYSNNIHLEITNLVIPTLNDKEEDFAKLAKFIAENLGKEIPLHFSAFFPTYKRQNISATSSQILDKAVEIAKSYDLAYVYKGNVEGQSNTYCSSCQKLLIERQRFQVKSIHLNKGMCPSCQSKLYGEYNDK